MNAGLVLPDPAQRRQCQINNKSTFASIDSQNKVQELPDIGRHAPRARVTVREIMTSGVRGPVEPLAVNGRYVD